MREELTAEQFRVIWRRAGGEAIPMPIQAPSRGRMMSERDRIGRELDAWWAANEDPELYAAVRALRHSPVLLCWEGYLVGGRPLRALLGGGGAGVGGGVGGAVLVVQDAVAAVRERDSRDWFPDAAVDAGGWSLERGGDIRVAAGESFGLVERMAAAAPEFAAGTTPALRGEPAADDGSESTDGEYTSRASTTSKGERIAALLARPSTQRGSVRAAVADGVGWREIGRFDWIVVAGDGGYLVVRDSPGSAAVSVRPAARGDLATAARALLASAVRSGSSAESVVSRV